MMRIEHTMMRVGHTMMRVGHTSSARARTCLRSPTASQLEATQGQIFSQSLTVAARFWWHLYMI